MSQLNENKVVDDQQWSCIHNGNLIGPFSTAQLSSMFNAGIILADTLVWTNNNQIRERVAKVIGLDELPPPIPPTYKMLSPNSIAQTWINDRPHPWRRYLARVFDITINSSVTLILIAFTLTAISPDIEKEFFSIFDRQGGGFYLDAMIIYFVSIFPNALLMRLTGTTLGKWLFGVRILDSEDHAITFSSALKRELNVWVSGCALGIPIATLVWTVSAYNELDPMQK